MSFSKESAVDVAKHDLATRLKINPDDVGLSSAEDFEFPNAALGSPVDGELAAMMISEGWKIVLNAEGNSYNYRADQDQLRLHNFDGKNYVIEA